MNITKTSSVLPSSASSAKTTAKNLARVFTKGVAGVAGVLITAKTLAEPILPAKCLLGVPPEGIILARKPVVCNKTSDYGLPDRVFPSVPVDNIIDKTTGNIVGRIAYTGK